MKRIFLLIALFALTVAKSQTVVEAETFNGSSGDVQLVNGGTRVGYLSSGEYVQWSINVTQAGFHRFIFNISNDQINQSVQLRSEAGSNLSSVVAVPNTGSFGTFTDITIDAVIPTTGVQNIRLYQTGAGFGPDLERFSWQKLPTTANAGSDQVKSGIATGQTTTALLEGSGVSGSGVGGLTYQWTKVSGPSGGSISTPTTASTNVTSLQSGTYVFRLTVTASDETTGTDDVQVKVRLCEGGERYEITSTGDVYLEATGYSSRTHKYPTYGYPSPVYKGGDTVILRNDLNRFWMFGYDGTEGCPIVVMGDIIDKIPVQVSLGIQLRDCNYIKVTGKTLHDKSISVPSRTDTFLIRIGDGPARDIALGAIGRSSHIDFEGIYGNKIWYISHFKTDFQDVLNCDSIGYTYPYAPNLSYISLKYSYFTNISQDGVYAGSTDPSGDQRTYTCGGSTVSIIPQHLESITIYRNYIAQVARTAIQLSGGYEGTHVIAENVIHDTGYELNQQQGTGISLGFTLNAHVRANRIRNTFLYGIFDIGAGTNYIYDNDIDSTGYIFDSRDSGLFNAVYPAVDREAYIASVPTELTYATDGVLKNIKNGDIANIASTTKPTTPHTQKGVFIVNNKIGIHSGAENSGNGTISFRNYGPVGDWVSNNFVCDNKTQANIPILLGNGVYQFNNGGTMWPPLQTCATIPAFRLSIGGYVRTYVTGVKLKRKAALNLMRKVPMKKKAATKPAASKPAPKKKAASKKVVKKTTAKKVVKTPVKKPVAKPPVKKYKRVYIRGVKLRKS